jgi:glycolate oxidase
MNRLFSPTDLAVMASVREAFNPTLICSPMKMLPTAGACGTEEIHRTGAARQAM